MSTATKRPVHPSGPPDETPASVRRAALYLHSLAEADRQWVLAALEPGERSRLIALLAELKRLGFSGDRSLLDEAAGTRTELSAHEKLRGADAARLAALLLDEPPALVARLLAAGDWPWRDELLRRVGPEGRRRIAVAGEQRSGRPAPVLEAAIVESVVRRLDAMSARGDGSRGRGRLARILGGRGSR